MRPPTAAAEADLGLFLSTPGNGGAAGRRPAPARSAAARRQPRRRRPGAQAALPANWRPRYKRRRHCAEHGPRARTAAPLANSTARSGSGSVSTSAHSPEGGPASALAKAAVGAGGAGGLITIQSGQAASNAAMALGGGYAVGAMSAGYGGSGETVTYTATADFAFATDGARGASISRCSTTITRAPASMR